MKTYKIKSHVWGWLDVEEYKIDGPFLVMINVTRDGKPFYPTCMITTQDVALIVPKEG